MGPRLRGARARGILRLNRHALTIAAWTTATALLLLVTALVALNI